MAKRFRSPVWEFYYLVGEKSVKCKLCDRPGTVLRYQGGTKNNEKSLDEHHPGEYSDPEKDKSAKSQSTLDNFVRTKKCHTERSNEITRIAEMVARDMRPISRSGRRWL